MTENALPESTLYRMLLPESDLHSLDEAIRWLTFGGFLSTVSWGISDLKVYQLNEKGIAAAEADSFPEEERQKFYREDPYAVFLARQFTERDRPLVDYLQCMLFPQFHIEEGTAEALEEFRTSILRKIRRSRYFICLLTRRQELTDGGYASSVWLYQEIGAAMALGREPIVLVETGLSEHYAGELQRVYEFISFSRDSYQEAFQAILPRLMRDLEHAGIPAP